MGYGMIKQGFSDFFLLKNENRQAQQYLKELKKNQYGSHTAFHLCAWSMQRRLQLGCHDSHLDSSFPTNVTGPVLKVKQRNIFNLVKSAQNYNP